MRRKDRELKDMDSIFEIINNCSVAHVAMTDKGKPYVVALNFGYDRMDDELILYFHSACDGKKIEILKEHPSVYFQMDCANELVEGPTGSPCSTSWKFHSVMGSGEVEFLNDKVQKTHALNRILQHLYKKDEHFSFPEKMLSKTCIYRVCSTDITGKRHS